MGDVYSQAFFTIIVAAGENANDKIPHLRGVNPRVEVRLKEHIAFRVFTHAACALGKSKWASRAWTFQEGYLSPRRLIFTDEDVFFLCNRCLAAESSKVNIQNETLKQAKQSDIWKFIPAIPQKSNWKDKAERMAALERHISEFSKRHLSFESDSLNALLGVLSDATKERHSFPIRHHWGVPYRGPSTSMQFDIHWKHHAVAKRRPAFPSWSWCGWSGGVSFEQRGTPISYDGSLCLFSVRLPMGERIALGETVRSPIPASKGMPKDLFIKTRIVLFHFAPEAPQTTETFQPHAGFLVDENSFAQVPVAMDEWPLASDTQCIGILLEHELSKLTSSAMVMLVAKAVGDHYERVGIVELHSERETLVRSYVSNGQRPLHDGYSCEPWFCVQFCDVHYVDGEGKQEGLPFSPFKPDKLSLQPWYRDAEIKEICLR